MESALDLRDIQALTSLQAALSSFSEGLRGALDAGNSDIQGRLGWMQAKIEQRRWDVEEAHNQVEIAEADLYACQNSGYYTPEGYYVQPDCSYQIAILRQAKNQLRQAEMRFDNALAWQARLQQAADEFNELRTGMDRLGGEHTSQAQAALSQLAERYAAVHSSAAAVVAPVVRPVATSGGQWFQRGVQNVNVSQLPALEGISSASDFSKVPESEMRAGLQRFQEMRPVIESGAGNSSDYWAGQDRQRGLDYATGYQRIYEAFYGRDAIYVEKNGDNYDIINGRHRIWLAQQMGIDQLPMRISERQPPQR